LQLFEGTFEMRHSKEPSDAPLMRVVETLKALQAALVDRAPHTAGSPVAAGWLACVCRFLSTAASAACLILQCWAAKIPLKKSKGKKGKAALAAAASLSAHSYTGAVRIAHTSALDMFAGLCTVLEDRLATKTGAIETFFLSEPSVILDLASDLSFRESRRKLFAAIESSHSLSVARLAPLVQSKVKSLGVLPQSD
jgi:hypothetical protein